MNFYLIDIKGGEKMNNSFNEMKKIDENTQKDRFLTFL